MKKSNTKAERAKAVIRFKEFMNGWAGSIRDAEYSDPDSIDGMRYRIPTKAGELRLTLYMEKGHSPWMAGRFDDVDKAKQFYGLGRWENTHRLNVHSGKWNFQSDYTPNELIDQLTSELEQLRPMKPERREALIAAATSMDWGQVVGNGGPPCFHLCDDGSFCGRAERWDGHWVTYKGDVVIHKFVSLSDLLKECHEQREK